MNKPPQQSVVEPLQEELREYRQDRKRYEREALIAHVTGEYTVRPPLPLPEHFRAALRLRPGEIPLDKDLDTLEQTFKREAGRGLIRPTAAHNTSASTQQTPVSTAPFRGEQPRGEGHFHPSNDYCRISYQGETYKLTPAAGQIVRVLHEAHKEGKVGVSSTEIKKSCKCGKVWDQFRRLDGPKFRRELIRREDKNFFKLNLPPLC